MDIGREWSQMCECYYESLSRVLFTLDVRVKFLLQTPTQEREGEGVALPYKMWNRLMNIKLMLWYVLSFENIKETRYIRKKKMHNPWGKFIYVLWLRRGQEAAQSVRKHEYIMHCPAKTEENQYEMKAYVWRGTNSTLTLSETIRSATFQAGAVRRGAGRTVVVPRILPLLPHPFRPAPPPAPPRHHHHRS